jgi:hypothetical protein
MIPVAGLRITSHPSAHSPTAICSWTLPNGRERLRSRATWTSVSSPRVSPASAFGWGDARAVLRRFASRPGDGACEGAPDKCTREASWAILFHPRVERSAKFRVQDTESRHRKPPHRCWYRGVCLTVLGEDSDGDGGVFGVGKVTENLAHVRNPATVRRRASGRLRLYTVLTAWRRRVNVICVPRRGLRFQIQNRVYTIFLDVRTGSRDLRGH